MRTRRSNSSPWGHGIVSAGAEGMAPGEAFEREPATLGHAVKSDGLGRVVRARGHEAARSREERRNEQLIAAQQRQRHGDPGGSFSLRRRPTGLSVPVERCVRECCGIHFQGRPGWPRGVRASAR